MCILIHSFLLLLFLCNSPVCFLQTPVDKQELLCGQLAGVGRCVSELSSSPVRVLKLRRSKYAIRMKDDFFWVSALTGGPSATFQDDFVLTCLFWDACFFSFFSSQALGCAVEVPTTSVCELLDQLINLFCFYNGSVRQSYQVHTPVVLLVLQQLCMLKV